MTDRLTFALEVAHRAGRATLPYFQTQTNVEFKQDNSPIT